MVYNIIELTSGQLQGGLIAQKLEQVHHNRKVTGSSPFHASLNFCRLLARLSATAKVAS